MEQTGSRTEDIQAFVQTQISALSVHYAESRVTWDRWPNKDLYIVDSGQEDEF